MSRPRVGFWTLVLATLVLALPASAYDAKPPQPRDCDMTVPADQYNERIDCKAENANVALFDYVDAVIEYEKASRSYGRDPIFTDAQLDHFDKARDRAQKAKERTRQAKGFRGQVKKQKPRDADCYVQEIIGDNKGDDVQPCEKNEDCSEEIGDGIGDDDGICKVKGNPNQREVCIQVCQEPLPDDTDVYDDETLFDTEQGLDELAVVLDEAAGEVQKATARMHDYYATRPTHANNDCDLYQYDLFPGPIVLQVSQVAKNIADAVFNSCSVACNQDSFGWNCELACVVFAVIAGVANGVDDGFNVADGNNGSQQLDRVAKCTTQLDDDIDGLQASAAGQQESLDEVNEKIDELAKQVDALMLFMETRFLDVENHLCVPQGQRECFPDGVNRFEETPVSRAAPPKRSRR